MIRTYKIVQKLQFLYYFNTEKNNFCGFLDPWVSNSFPTKSRLCRRWAGEYIFVMFTDIFVDFLQKCALHGGKSELS